MNVCGLFVCVASDLGEFFVIDLKGVSKCGGVCMGMDGSEREKGELTLKSPPWMHWMAATIISVSRAVRGVLVGV